MANTPLFDAVLQSDAPRRLYHYTSVDGLAAILSSRTVWASAVQFLNDAREFRLAIDLAWGVLYQHAQRAGGSPLGRLLTYYHEQIGRAANRTVCVFSLSEEGDLLSQWRGYCPASGGYSLGLPGRHLRRQASAHGCRLAKCVYDPGDQERLLREAVDPFVALLPVAEIPTADAEFQHFAELWLPPLLQRVAQVAPLVKHEGFSEEREWRLIWTHDDTDLSLQFRPARGMFVPYVAVPIAVDGQPMPSFDVVVGPMPHQQLALDSLTGYLLSRDLNWEMLHTSRIPYRNW